MDEAVEIVKKRWDELSKDFDIFEKVMQQSWRSVLFHMELQTSSRVLEVGAGRGECSKALLSALPPNAFLTSTDISTEMIKYIESTLSNTKFPNLRIQVANAQDLPFVDGCMDRYIGNMIIHLIPDPDKALKEARRVLKPGGIAGFSIWGSPEKSQMFSCLPDGYKTSNFILGKDISSLRKRFKEAGFNQFISWRQQCPLELWNAEKAVQFWVNFLKIDRNDPLNSNWFAHVRKGFRETLERGEPIGLEAIIIIAR
jgi:ubiquinone/menaquinone biosynthesis C-methylase UbiE